MHKQPLLFVKLLIFSGMALAHGDVHRRIHQLSDEIARHPGKIEFLEKRGEMFLLERHGKQAYEDFNTIRGLAPQRFDVLYPLAKSQLMMNQHDAALLSIREFLQHADNDAARMRGNMLLAELFSITGKQIEAANAYLQAMKLSDPLEPDTVLFAVNAFRLAGQVDRALEVLNFAISQLGHLQTLDEQALELEMQKNSYDAALRRVEQMMVNNRRQPFLLYKKALIFKSLSRMEESRQILAEALQAIAELPVSRQKLAPLANLKASVVATMQESN